MKKYIDFSFDHDGVCECVDDFIVDDESFEIWETDVQPLIEELKKIEGCFISTTFYRTRVRIWWNENGTMDVLCDYFSYYGSIPTMSSRKYPTTSIIFEPHLVS